jgi:hypothetical protein
MTPYAVLPLIGIGPVRLKMTREESRRAMGRPPDPVQKSSADGALTDAYFDSAFQVFFDDRDLVEYIEVSGPGPDIAALYLGKDAHRTEAAELVKRIVANAPYDPDDPELGWSYLFPSLELSLWRPTAEEPYFATIGIGRHGYFSQA